jgi:hypothetical protein
MSGATPLAIPPQEAVAKRGPEIIRGLGRRRRVPREQLDNRLRERTLARGPHPHLAVRAQELERALVGDTVQVGRQRDRGRDQRDVGACLVTHRQRNLAARRRIIDGFRHRRRPQVGGASVRRGKPEIILAACAHAPRLDQACALPADHERTAQVDLPARQFEAIVDLDQCVELVAGEERAGLEIDAQTAVDDIVERPGAAERGLRADVVAGAGNAVAVVVRQPEVIQLRQRHGRGDRGRLGRRRWDPIENQHDDSAHIA